VLSQRLRDALPNATLVMVPSAGHMVMIENFKAFNRAVLDFIVFSGHSLRSLKKE
jgi:pimeloyl-ACP methyl ester carboxylesterase